MLFCMKALGLSACSQLKQTTVCNLVCTGEYKIEIASVAIGKDRKTKKWLRKKL